MNKFFLLTIIALSFIIRGFLILNGKHVADIWHIAQMGNALLAGQNPYLVLDFNVYPPLSLAISALSSMLSNITNIPFHMILKLWPNLADLGTAILIYKYLSKQKIKRLFVVFWTGLFVLNPISVIISAAHGQLDSISSFLVVLAIYYLTKYPILSFLSLGLSIAVKPNPLVLVPLFLFVQTTSFKKQVQYLLILLAPVIISMLPFLTNQPISIIKNLLGYSGVADFGYAAILRGIWFQYNANPHLPLDLTNQFLSSSKLILIIGVGLLSLLFCGRKHISRSALAVYLLFISLYFGIGAQYLSWVIPLAIMAKERFVIFFMLPGAIALVGFYLYFGPDILLGKLVGSLMPFENKYFYYYFYGNLILWISCLFWLGKIIVNHLQLEFSKFTNTKKQLLTLGTLILILILIPLLKAMQNFIKIYGLLEN